MNSQTKKLARRAPWVEITPHTLTDTAPGGAGGETVTVPGFRFDLPWNDLNPELTKTTDHRVVYEFKSGRSLMVTRAPSNEFTDAHLLPVRGREDAVRVFGEKTMQSDYAFIREMLEARPSDAGWFSSRSQLVRTWSLLTVKSVFSREPSGNFYIRSAEIPGIQLGDPKARPERIITEFFTDDADTEFVFFQSKTGPPISQGEINRVTQTMKRADVPAEKQAANLRP